MQFMGLTHQETVEIRDYTEINSIPEHSVKKEDFTLKSKRSAFTVLAVRSSEKTVNVQIVNGAWRVC